MAAGSRAGCVHHTGYRHIKIDGEAYQASSIAWLYVYGVWPSDEVDHKNLDRGDDRIKNLREATASQNQANRPAFTTSASGTKGVRWRERNGTKGVWVAQIKKDGKVMHLGHFDQKKLAMAAYRTAARRYHGEFARF